MVASAYGVPPDWIDNIVGSEAWALHEGSSGALPGTVFKFDCKPCVDLMKAGLSVAGQGKRMIARIYRLIFTSIDEHSAANVVWMLAHTSADEVGKRKLGDGTLLSATDRFGNAEADRLAKLGVEAHRVPVWCVKTCKDRCDQARTSENRPEQARTRQNRWNRPEQVGNV